MSRTLQKSDTTRLAEVIASHKAAILEDWITEMSGATRRADLMKDAEFRAQCAQFLRAWKPTLDGLGDISRSRAQQGFTPSETATFVFSVKKSLFSILGARQGSGIAKRPPNWCAPDLHRSRSGNS